MAYYKYRPISRYLIESIVTPSIYFSRPRDLNDPFDCQLNIDALLNDEKFSTIESLISLKQGMIKEGFHTNSGIHRGFQDHGIFSMSKKDILEDGETLMWSHYAKNHTGVRLKYNFDKYMPDNAGLYGDVIKKFPNPTNFSEMYYGDYSEFIKDLEEHSMQSSSSYELFTTFCNAYLVSKHPAWKYEHECRFIRPQFGAVEIDKDCLEEVCFGLNTSCDDMKIIKEYASKFCGCREFKRKIRGDSLYGFNETEV